MNRWREILALLLCFSLASPALGTGAAGLNTIPVTSLGDDVAVNGNCTLREAILAADRDVAVDACPAGHAGMDTILVPAGKITLKIEGAAENEGLTGDLDIRSDMIIAGAGQDQTVIDADHLDRVVDIFGVDYGTVEIRDLTVQNGRLSSNVTQSEEENPGFGGGIRMEDYSSTLKLVRVKIAHNFTDESPPGNGGGVFSDGTLEIYDSLFEKNGSAREGGALSVRRNVLIEGASFVDNNSYGAAALLLDESAEGSIRGVELYGNLCGPAGWAVSVGHNAQITLEDFAVRFSDCEEATVMNYGSLTLRDGVFAQNNAPFGSPGESGVVKHNEGNLQVENVHFQNNHAAAAILVMSGDARIEESLFSGNKGTGLYIRGGATELTNSTFSTTHLTDADFSAGVWVKSGFLALESVTLANLQGGKAALQVDGGNVTVHNSLLAYNQAISGVAQDCSLASGTTVSAGYNLISVRDGCGWRSATGDQLGTRASPLDPLLGPLAETDPEHTQAQPLMPGSPAIDAADPEDCPPADQREVDRPQGPRCDIGAYEALRSAPIEDAYQCFMPVIQK